MDKTISGLGELIQLAFVPRDYDAAIKYWTETMGVGPFFEMNHIKYMSAAYRGAPSDLDFSVALAYWGDIQIELIRQHNDSPSIYKAWLDEGREGLHHTCIVVDDMAQARKVCAEAGASVEQEIRVTGVEAIYIDSGGGPGTLLELITIAPEFKAVFDGIRDASRGWDGRDPVRSLG